jgi:hypothetical protein
MFDGSPTISLNTADQPNSTFFGLSTTPSFLNTSGAVRNYGDYTGMNTKISATHSGGGYLNFSTSLYGIRVGTPTVSGNIYGLNVYGIRIGDQRLSTSNSYGITTYYGLKIDETTEMRNVGGSVAYGIHVTAPSGSGGNTSNYGIYQAGTGDATQVATNVFEADTYFVGSVDVEGQFSVGTQATLAVDDATPDVSAGSTFITANTSVTITDFDAGAGTLENGQVFFLEFGDANTTIDCDTSGNINCGSTDITGAVGDIMTFFYDGTDWHMVSYMDDSDNHSAGSGFDIAEWFISRGDLTPGDLVSIDPQGPTPEYIVRSTTTSDSKLIGIVSTNPGITLGEPTDDLSAYPIALAGRVPVKVSGENGDIAPGDPLTSSSTAGVAMKATKSGPIIGKALEAYSGSGVGKIMVFVSTGWYVASVGDSSNSLADLIDLNVENLVAGTVSTSVLFIEDRKLDMAPDGTLVVDGSVNVLGDLSIGGDVEITGELTTKKLNVGKEAAGSAVLEAGETKAVVETQAVTGKSQVLITPNTLTEKNLTVTKKEADKGFTVEITSPEAKDIEFDWLIVN